MKTYEEQLRAELAQLKEQNRELMKDKERLDLLEKNKHVQIVFSELMGAWVLRTGTDSSLDYLCSDKTLRQALDKAALAKGVTIDHRNPLRTCSHGMLADQCGICKMPVKDDLAKESSE